MSGAINRVVAAALFVLLAVALPVRAQSENRVTLTGPQVAGISMFRAHWNTPMVLTADGPQKVSDAKITDRGGAAVWKDSGGAIAFDALNRSVLVRFPGAAERIASELAKGQQIARVELVLPFRDEELWPVGGVDYVGPDGYNYRTNWGVDAMYRAVRPQWHAVAWALRRPWIADAKIGPTFNASIAGTVHWTKFGAGDRQSDRHATSFGPAEVSYKNVTGRIDLTALLTDPSFGATLAARLRTFTDCGVLVQKLETYDIRYFNGVYEFGTSTGGRAILIREPALEITFTPGKAELGEALPPAADVAAIATGPKIGVPTAVMPERSDLPALAQRLAQKPEWMPEWQWQRVRELQVMEKPQNADEPFWFRQVPEYLIDRASKYRWDKGVKIIEKPADPAVVYEIWVDLWLGRQVRGWSGFESARAMAEWHLYRDAMPAPVHDAVRRYWTAWLMPDRETALEGSQRRDRNDISGKLVHPMVDDARVGGQGAVPPDPAAGRFDSYFTKTGDWRGNKSFFRSGFCYDMSTQNFNTTAASGALLGGAIINSPRAMTDGRHGVRNWLLSWAWGSGLGQEHIDHYYFAHTLVGNKAIADFSQEPYDKLIGQSMITKGVEELACSYHPGLRSFIAGSARSSLEFQLGMQDGLQHIVHTLARSGAERDVNVDKFPQGFKRIGHDVAPDLVAQLSVTQPWAPSWVEPMFDDKPLPFEVVATGWQNSVQRKYMGVNYGLASSDLFMGRFQAVAQWRREARQVQSTSELGFLDLRFTTNTPRWTNNNQGRLDVPASQAVLQDKNRLIAIMSPHDCPEKDSDKKPVTSLQTSVGLFTMHEGSPPWEIYVDGQRVSSLPFTCKQGQKITIRDGVTYLGIIPLPSSNLGRSAEVVLEDGVPQKCDLDFYKSTLKASLVINSYLYRSDKPITDPAAKLAASRAYGGFTLEIGDVNEHGSFENFQKHFSQSQAQVTFDAKKNLVDVTYRTGKDVLRASSVTRFDDKDGEKWGANFETATLNGKPANPPKGLELDTPYSQQAVRRVSKNGVTLSGDPQRRLFLLTEPQSGVYCAWNPLPEMTTWNLDLPSGLNVIADGRVGLCRMEAKLKENVLAIDHHFSDWMPKQSSAATALLISPGSSPLPKIVFNGDTMEQLESRVIDGKTYRVIPLQSKLRTNEEMKVLLGAIRGAAAMERWPEHDRMLLREWNMAGPFPANTKFESLNLQQVKWELRQAWGGGVGGPRTIEGLYKGTEPQAWLARATVVAQQACQASATVQLEADGGTEEFGLYLNGQLVSNNPWGTVQLNLKSGDNELLVWVRQKSVGRWGNTLRFHMGTPIFNYPMLRGVSYKTASGNLPVNPTSVKE